MLEKTKQTVTTCSSIYKRKNQLAKKLLRNPFFPLLFLSEFIKMVTIALVSGEPLLSATTTGMGVLAAVSTTVWIFAEHLLEEAKETYETVTDE